MHGLKHYLINPANSVSLFSRIFDISFKEVYADAVAAYEPLTLEGHAQAARQKLEAIDISDENSIENLEKALKALSTFIRGLGDDVEF